MTDEYISRCGWWSVGNVCAVDIVHPTEQGVAAVCTSFCELR
jgi:hypothetical protein